MGFILLAVMISFSSRAAEPPLVNASPTGTPIITLAVMCEGVRDQHPLNSTIIFSVSQEKAYCFTAFESVSEETYIFHNWYRKDKLSTKIKLLLNPPQWATYSGIHFRRADIGPWRVEITDQKGRILKILRFSITE